MIHSHNYITKFSRFANSALVTLVVGLAAVASAAQPANPAPSPPPTLASDGTRSHISLDGTWQTLPIEGLDFKFPPPATGWVPTVVPNWDATSIETVRGPYSSNVDVYLNKEGTGFKRTKGMAAWFQHEFTLPSALPVGQQVLLHFSGIASRGEIWFNGTKIGTSLQGLIPVEYDISTLIKPGASNSIVIGLTEREGVIDIAHKTYLAPTWGSMSGMWGSVDIRFLPKTYVADSFIKPSVKNKKIEFETTLINTTPAPHTLVLRGAIVNSDNIPQTTLDPITVTLAANETKVVTLSKNWIAPHLWDFQSPTLYRANLLLLEGPKLVDKWTDRFGFREFEIRGRDFYLNNRRFHLLRSSQGWSMGTPKDRVVSGMQQDLGKPINCVRLHAGFDAEPAFEAADELGMPLVPESGWHQAPGGQFVLEQRQLWLDNVLKYYSTWIKMHRNHPSIIMWSLTNESMWGATDPLSMEVAQKLLDNARAADPTRPMQGDAEVNWDKRLPIVNIHYPEGSMQNSLLTKYTNSGLVMPNDAYWLNPDVKVSNLTDRSDFKWNCPIVIGEYWCPSGEPDAVTSYTGEQIYDWQKWRMDGTWGRAGRTDSEYINALQQMTDAYRAQGVAGVNPWSGCANQTMPMVAVRPLDFHPNFYGGTTGTRKVVIFNDGRQQFGNMGLQVRLDIDGVAQWDKKVQGYAEPGETNTVSIPLDIPNVTRQTKATLTISLQWTAGEINRLEESIFIMPRESLANIDPKRVILLDGDGQTSKTLKTLGLPLSPLTQLSLPTLRGAKLLIVGDNSDAAASAKDIGQFITEGGSVIILRQEKSSALLPELPRIDETHVSSRVWKRCYDHPITAGMENLQFSYWQPDNLVSFKSLRKTNLGISRNILDCGGRYGMRWSPLVETPLGNGVVIQSQLKLVQAAEVEPAAAHLLAQTIRYAMTFRPPPTAPLRLLAGGNTLLRQALAAGCVVTTDGLTGDGPILLDASASPTANELELIQSYLIGGGKVWLHGFGTDTVDKIAKLLPFKARMVACDSTVPGAARRSNDPLMNNLNSGDFFWSHIDFGSSDFMTGGKITAKLGKETLVLPNIQAGQELMAPALMTKIPAGKGFVLFDTLAWEDAQGAEADKSTRIVSALASNLGVQVRPFVEKVNYAYFPVDLSKQANMGYYDRVADDGKGGWTDQGRNDMRLFLINHTGKAGAEDNGMDEGSQNFPASATFVERPFTLLDPKQSKDHSIISLRGTQHGTKLPDKAVGIPVKRKASKLWFLHASSWNELPAKTEVARYVIHYENGATEVFPIRSQMEVGDWCNPQPLPNGKMAWTGRNLEHALVGITLSEWTNPNPQKAITSIDLIGNLSPAQYVLLAISGGELTGK